MATKWKNNLLIVVVAALITFGLSGALIFFTTGTEYMHKDYFQTNEFRGELHQFAHNLNMFALNDTTLDEAIEEITVTQDEINDHRYRFGSLEDQLESIREQYVDRIEAAQELGYEGLEQSLIEERDEKLEDITANFASDDHIREKIVEEKAQDIRNSFHQKERNRAQFQRDLEQYHYFFTNMETGETFTNVEEPPGSAGNDGATGRQQSGQPNEEASGGQQIGLRGYSAEYVVEYDWSEEIREAHRHVNEYNSIFTTEYSLHASDASFYHLYYNYHENDAWFHGKIGVANQLPSNNPLMIAADRYKSEQKLVFSYIISAIVALIIGLVMLIKSRGIRDELTNWQAAYSRIPLDVRVIALVFTAAVPFVILIILGQSIHYTPVRLWDNFIWNYALSLGILAVTGSIAMLQLWFLASEVRRWKTFKAALKKSVSYRVWLVLKKPFARVQNLLQEAFLNRSTGTQFYLILLTVFAFGFGAISFFMHPILGLGYLAVLAIVGVPLFGFLTRRIGYFNRIVEKADEIAAGKLGRDLPVTGHSGAVLTQLANNINVLEESVKTSQSEQAKSERLKTELITNVSHDLRTPLTSIITYTELLKSEAEDLSAEEREAYVKIIDNKSKRLKVLIDDLFEVSKMASGNIELRKDTVDICQLLEQALAEYDDAIRDSSLDFRVSKVACAEPVFAFVDGQKLWRVFDNLIGNILKYSLENTRVYLAVSVVDRDLVISFKNISKYELNGEHGELVERFKRGDTSRQTEGSGLGLAIAQSIVELHDGVMDLATDGDLFKVTVKLPLEKR
ncbi:MULTISPECIES: sensor histidine kinase [Bacillaceae]|uniref:histidine kinase n=1 Tax=Evansella alkalicola TaxID=745819 RepID=A0ABS6JW89_9BACI|nr:MULTISPECIES: histidine kinase dimerization/phospho-acceptor domain-containing protein [Bacillaceae]MBU9722763.1 GHKL domain-containing protein [Bacillus alkalicola]